MNAQRHGPLPSDIIETVWEGRSVRTPLRNFAGRNYPTILPDVMRRLLDIPPAARTLTLRLEDIRSFHGRLPYADRAFDFLWCLDGLETVSDPSALCMEMQRVARRGLIETASPIGEMMIGDPRHRWFIESEGVTLRFRPRPFRRSPFAQAVRSFWYGDAEFRMAWELRYRNIVHTQFYWEDAFAISLLPPTPDDYDPDDPLQAAEAHLDSALNALRFGAVPAEVIHAEIDATLRLRPEWGLAWNARGCCLWRERRYAEARDAFRQAAQCEPEVAVFRENAALLHGQSLRLALLPDERADTTDIAENWAGKVYYAFVNYDDRLAQDLGIRPGERVLDVGSGQRPLRRADVCVDFDIFEGTHRQGQAISRQKPLVCGDVQRLPFRDKTFDVVCCRMVLEHTNDPAAAVKELLRVGKRVFIETPNVLWECFYGHPCHRWFISYDGKTLLFRRKRDGEIPFRSAIVPWLYTQQDIQRRFEVTLRNVTTVQILTEGDLEVRVEDDPEDSESTYDYNRPGDAFEALLAYAEDLVRYGLPGVAIPEVEDALKLFPADMRARHMRQRIAQMLGEPPAVHRLRSPTPVLQDATHTWNAPLFDPSGYAEEARHFLLALEEAGFTFAALPIRWSHRVAVLPREIESRLLAMTARRPQPGGVHVSHIFPPNFTRRTDARLNIGRTMFETDRLPEGWAHACNQMDRIWVPGDFNRETFARAGIPESRIAVVPGAIDLAFYDPSVPSLAIDGARGYNFLSVFDWTRRKGWDILIRAFVEEFEPEEDVALIIKTHSSLGYSIPQIVERVADYIRDVLRRDPDRTADIIFQDSNLPVHQMVHLYRAADCFVLPTHGEGWGRPYMEAMAMGLPTIGTGWSGNTAFMTPQNSYLIDYRLIPVPEEAYREAPAFKGHRWAEPDLDHLRAIMRHVFTHREEAKAVGARARADIGERFSYQRVAAIIAGEMERAGALQAA